ncbi:MAG: SDR family oxidoreductase [Lachnospiraceae bacterium]|nr:SDR family oxidoreductase [Lachnospiraceae bacterium]
MKKVAIICGAGPVGSAAACALSEAGIDIAVLDENVERAESVVKKLDDVKAIALAYDTADEDSIRTAVQKVEEQMGRVDALFNADLKIKRNAAKDVTLASFETAFKENVLAYFCVARACAEIMAKNGGGRIVNLSSVHSHVADGRHLEYATVTNAINALTRELATNYWKNNIQVNTIVAAFIDGQFPDEMDLDQRQTPEQISLLGRRITPEDLAKTVRFLFTSDTKVVNGSEIRADAGYLTTQYRVGDVPFTKITD